ncbi:MAG: ATP synthase F0 subunit B [Candidatus Zixiibacteriota bacterium]|nr:MAG: ATP synthase F0 subunit B [candidate division Zixibacteria bacterium]
MSIDFQQLLAHAIGFLLTLWILKRFAWGPLLDMLEERRSKIAGEFDNIEKQKAEVAALTATYEGKLREIDNERRQKLIEAAEEGKKMAAEIKAAAMAEVKQLREKTKADLEREVAKARVELKQELIAMTMTATERLIKERLDDTKHRDLIGRYIDELEQVG